MAVLQCLRAQASRVTGCAKGYAVFVHLRAAIDMFSQAFAPIIRLIRLLNNGHDLVRESFANFLIDKIHLIKLAKHGSDTNAGSLSNLCCAGIELAEFEQVI